MFFTFKKEESEKHSAQCLCKELTKSFFVDRYQLCKWQDFLEIKEVTDILLVS